MDLTQAIIPAMVLAPSAHNTQPWKFEAGEGYIDVYADWSRFLGVSDPDKRQLYESLGCTIENAATAGEALPYAAQVTYFPQGMDKEKPAARITFTERQRSTQAQRLYEAIPKRRTDRSIYNAHPLTETERNALPTLQSQSVMVLNDRQAIARMADLTSEGTFTSLAKPEFKKELALWVRSSLTKKHDGMPGDSMGLPAPIALIAPWIVPIAPIHKQEGPNAKKQMNSASVVAVIVTKEDTPRAFMEVGRLLQRLWLEATAAGLAAAVHASSVEASSQLRQRTKEAFGITGYPQTVLRIGHSNKKNLKPTPRRTVEDCIKQ